MDSRGRHRAGWIWALLLSSSVLYFFTINEADNDLWGHIRFGRDILASHAVPHVDAYAYTTTGQAWMNHEWLSQVLLAAVYDVARNPGLLLLKLAIAATTCGLLFAVVRRRSDSPHVRGAVGLLTIAVLSRGFAMRPQIVTYLCLALTLWLLDRVQTGRRRALWGVPVLFLLWANLHGGFALGLAVLGWFAAAQLLAVRRTWTPWIALALSVLATVITPFGPRLLLYIWHELSRAHPITEWQAAQPSDVAQLVFFAMLGLVAVTLPLARGWRTRGWEVVLALGVGVMAVRHQRHTPVFALCASAPLTAQLDAAWRWATQRSALALGAGAQRVLAAALVVVALLQLGLTSMRWHRDGLQIVFDPREYPVAAVHAMQRAGLRANLAVPLDWGEYVLWFLAPAVKVSLDGRFATLFPESVVADNFDFFAGAARWQRLLDDYPTDAALVPLEAGCPIGTLPGWKLVYQDATARLYVREGSAAWSSGQRLIGLRPEMPRRDVFP